MLETFTADTLEEGDRLTVRTEGSEPIELEVIEIRSVGGDALERQPFSILFRGPAEPFLAQGTVPLEHPELGRFALFLVPIGPDEAGMRYEAILT